MFQPVSKSQQSPDSKEKNEPNIDNSSEFLAQMMKGNDTSMPPATEPMQMMDDEEEEPVQGEVMQKQEEEEEPIQGKTIQKQEEEEEIQAKADNTLQFREEEEEKVQAKADNIFQLQEEEEIQAKRLNQGSEQSFDPVGSTTKLPEDVQAKMENSFGTNFSNVNIHQNDDSANQMGALAYTQGDHVHFAPGQYNPNTQGGQELLGHELTHVVQQREGRVQPTKQGKGLPINDNPALENEADVMGKQAVQGKSADINSNENVENINSFNPDFPEHAQGDIIVKENSTIYITKVYSEAGDYYSGSYYDTFWSIAKRCNTNTENIRKLNPDVNPERLMQGQVLYIKRKKEKVAPRKKYKFTNFYGPRRSELEWVFTRKEHKYRYGKRRYLTLAEHTDGILREDTQIVFSWYYTDDDECIKKYYYYDKGISDWIRFDPLNIGNPETITEVALYAIGTTALIVGGAVILASGVITPVGLVKASADFVNQYVLQEKDFYDIDWADVAASGIISNEHLKNIFCSVVDITAKKRVDTDKNIAEIIFEFFVRTGASRLLKSNSPKSSIFLKYLFEAAKSLNEEIIISNMMKYYDYLEYEYKNKEKIEDGRKS